MTDNSFMKSLTYLLLSIFLGMTIQPTWAQIRTVAGGSGPGTGNLGHYEAYEWEMVNEFNNHIQSCLSSNSQKKKRFFNLPEISVFVNLIKLENELDKINNHEVCKEFSSKTAASICLASLPKSFKLPAKLFLERRYEAIAYLKAAHGLTHFEAQAILNTIKELSQEEQFTQRKEKESKNENEG